MDRSTLKRHIKALKESRVSFLKTLDFIVGKFFKTKDGVGVEIDHFEFSETNLECTDIIAVCYVILEDGTLSNVIKRIPYDLLLNKGSLS